MHKSKLIETLASFDEDEIERFDRFVRSPFFHTQNNFRDEVLLFEHIQKCILTGKLADLDKNSAYQYVYPHTSFVSGKLDKLMSRLFKTIRKFITFTYSKEVESEIQSSLALARFYRAKGMNKRFQDTIQLLKKEQKSIARPDKQFYQDQFAIEEELSTFHSLNNTRKGDVNFQSTIQSLDILYLVNNLEYTCGLLWQNKDVDLDLKQTLLSPEQFELLLNKTPYLNIPFVKIYFQAILLLRDINEEKEVSFFQFRDLLDEYNSVLPESTLKALRTIARNFCIFQYNKGNLNYLPVVVSLYKQDLKQGLLYYQNKLIPNTIFNIVQLGLELEEYDWIKEFLESHRHRITGTEYPEEVYRFNMASYYFRTKDFDQALDLLNDQYEDTYYNLAARRLEIKIYYEINSPLLVAKIDSFKVFIFRMSKKLLQEVHNTANNSFINILRQITNPKTKGNDKRIDKLIEKVKEESTISEKSWLLEKLKEMR